MADLRDALPPAESPADLPGEARVLSTARRRARFYPRLIVGLLVAAGVYLLLQRLWARSDDDVRLSWQFYGAAAACGLVAITGWGLLMRVRPEADIAQGRYGVAAWLGFPLCLFGFLAMIPLLVLAVSSEARERLDPHDRIRAHVDGDRLEIIFPRPTWDGITGAAAVGRGKTVNLVLDDVPVPASFFEDYPESHHWTPDHRRLIVNLRSLKTRLDRPAPEWVSINAIVDAKQILDHARLRIPQQRILVDRR